MLAAKYPFPFLLSENTPVEKLSRLMVYSANG